VRIGFRDAEAEPDGAFISHCCLGTWASRNADLAWRHHQEFATFKIVGVFAEHGTEVFDLGLQSGSRKPEENDASVRSFLLEDQRAEVAIGDDQDPLLFAGDCKDVFVGETVGEIPRDGLNVVSEILKVRDKPEISALVE
jgi:hypothetical protein